MVVNIFYLVFIYICVFYVNMFIKFVKYIYWCYFTNIRLVGFRINIVDIVSLDDGFL